MTASPQLHLLWLTEHYYPGQGGMARSCDRHAGSTAEILELVAYARETSRLEGVQPQIVLLAPQRPPTLPSHVIYGNRYPATPLLPLADRIITACGFNVMRQTTAYREQHRFLPFPRHFDDQFLRAARHRNEG